MPNPFEDPKDSLTIHISSMSILKLLAVFLVLIFVYIVWDVIVLLFVSVVFAASLGPIINWFEGRKIPRAAGILIIYASVFLVVSMITVLIIPPIREQIQQLSKSFPIYYDQIAENFGDFEIKTDVSKSIQSNIQSLGAGFSDYTTSVYNTILSLFGGVFTFIMVLVLTFYFLVKKDGFEHFIESVTPAKHQKYAIDIFNQIQDKLGFWLRAQLFISFVIFLFTLVGLSILDVRYALILALIAGITEVIPFVGPIIGAIPAVFIAFLDSPVKGFLVVIMYIVIQQLEGNVIVPKVMQKAVGLNPIVVIIVILLGAKLAGVLGALLSVPVAVAVMVVAQNLFGMPEHVLVRVKDKK